VKDASILPQIVGQILVPSLASPCGTAAENGKRISLAIDGLYKNVFSTALRVCELVSPGYKQGGAVKAILLGEEQAVPARAARHRAISHRNRHNTAVSVIIAMLLH
jgi:hypothetical protein